MACSHLCLLGQGWLFGVDENPPMLPSVLLHPEGGLLVLVMLSLPQTSVQKGVSWLSGLPNPDWAVTPCADKAFLLSCSHQ